MLQRRLFVTLILLLVLMVSVGCGISDSKSPVDVPDPGNGNDVPGDENGNNNDNGLPDWLEVDAASALPEPWMAYPGSMVHTDWQDSPWNFPYPSWLLVAPPGTSREDVIEYYVSMAEERDDFETIVVYHGITGTWLWKEYQIMIEADGYFDDPDLTQITFAFEEEID